MTSFWLNLEKQIYIAHIYDERKLTFLIKLTVRAVQRSYIPYSIDYMQYAVKKIAN